MTKRYSPDHEWAELNDGIVTVGITDFAQKQLGEVVFVELPDVDREVAQGEETAVVESVKAAGEVKAPLAGTVVEVNAALEDEPEKVNEDPTGDGWFYRIKPTDETALEQLLDEDGYQTLIADLD